MENPPSTNSIPYLPCSLLLIISPSPLTDLELRLCIVEVKHQCFIHQIAMLLKWICTNSDLCSKIVECYISIVQYCFGQSFTPCVSLSSHQNTVKTVNLHEESQPKYVLTITEKWDTYRHTHTTHSFFLSNLQRDFNLFTLNITFYYHQSCLFQWEYLWDLV